MAEIASLLKSLHATIASVPAHTQDLIAQLPLSFALLIVAQTVDCVSNRHLLVDLPVSARSALLVQLAYSELTDARTTRVKTVVHASRRLVDRVINVTVRVRTVDRIARFRLSFVLLILVKTVVYVLSSLINVLTHVNVLLVGLDLIVVHRKFAPLEIRVFAALV